MAYGVHDYIVPLGSSIHFSLVQTYVQLQESKFYFYMNNAETLLTQTYPILTDKMII